MAGPDSSNRIGNLLFDSFPPDVREALVEGAVVKPIEAGKEYVGLGDEVRCAFFRHRWSPAKTASGSGSSEVSEHENNALTRPLLFACATTRAARATTAMHCCSQMHSHGPS